MIPRVYRRRFVATKHAPSQARTWAATRLRALGLVTQVREDAVLVLDELVTNVIIHTTVDAFDVALSVTDALTVVVADDAPTRPSHRAPGRDSKSGRGMHIVDELTLAWRTSAAHPGKAVWARIALVPSHRDQRPT